MPCAFERRYKLTLVFCACAGNAFRNNFPLLGRETLQPLFVFVVDVIFFCVAEFTGALFTRHLAFFFTTRFTWTVEHGILLLQTLWLRLSQPIKNYFFPSVSLNNGSRVGTVAGASGTTAAAAAAAAFFAANAFELKTIVR